MRSFAKFGALGLVLLAAGCGSETGGAAPDSEPTTTATTITDCSDPLGSGAERVNAQELAFCQAEGIIGLAGYVQTDYIDGSVVSTSRVNMDPLAVEIKGAAQGDMAGTWVILVANKTYVNADGQWVQARADSDDENLQYQSSFPQRFAALLNPEMRAMAVDPTFEYDVIGTETVDGEETTVLSMNYELEGATANNRVYVRDDYVTVLTTTIIERDGEQTVRESRVSEIDQPQEIINPLFGE